MLGFKLIYGSKLGPTSVSGSEGYNKFYVIMMVMGWGWPVCVWTVICLHQESAKQKHISYAYIKHIYRFSVYLKMKGRYMAIHSRVFEYDILSFVCLKTTSDIYRIWMVSHRCGPVYGF